MRDADFLKDGVFRTCDNKGFHLTFPNGVTLSTQFGGGNYGSNYDARIGQESELRSVGADTVEVAAFDKEGGKWRTQEAAVLMGDKDPGDTVLGYIDMEKWLAFMDAVRKLPPTVAV